jgi:heme A synthase
MPRVVSGQPAVSVKFLSAQPPSNVARFARIVVAFNVAVIVEGAFVRATGSGAGCGNHHSDP